VTIALFFLLFLVLILQVAILRLLLPEAPEKKVKKKEIRNSHTVDFSLGQPKSFWDPYDLARF